jgi:DNA-binding response OmpR family regulator
MPSLLMIDDEPAIGTLVRRVGETCGYHVIAVSDAARFKSELETNSPDLIALDLTMPDTDGVELLRFLAAEGCTALVLIISGYSDRMVSTAVRLGEALGLNMAGVLHKPIGIAKLRATLVGLDQSRPAAA